MLFLQLFNRSFCVKFPVTRKNCTFYFDFAIKNIVKKKFVSSQKTEHKKKKQQNDKRYGMRSRLKQIFENKSAWLWHILRKNRT